MRTGRMALLALVAACSLSWAGEAYARGGAGGGQGGGMRLQKRDGSCINNQTMTQTQTRQQSQSGRQSINGVGANAGVTRQGMGQGAMRQLGPGDGTGNAVRPLDGTGYGAPAR